MGKEQNIFRKAIACCFLCTAVMASLYAQAGEGKIKTKWLSYGFDTSHLAGIVIREIGEKESLLEYNAHQHFIPASNVKLLTLLTALHCLWEQVPAARFLERNDTLWVWGAGDPGNLYPRFDSLGALLRLIKDSDAKTVVFSNAHFQAARFGSGWAWDDHPFDYQTERNAYPVYGNQLWVGRRGKEIEVIPAYWKPFVSFQISDTNQVIRSEYGESFVYEYDTLTYMNLSSAPVSWFPNDILSVYAELGGKNVIWKSVPLDPAAKWLPGSNRDTLLQIMMQESDNFIAEQLLLASSFAKLNVMSDTAIIAWAKDELIPDAKDKIQWVDGSGLSRYNLLTPSTVMEVLEEIHRKKGMEYIKSIFAGGQNNKRYGLSNKSRTAYIYAKSGSMRNQYCLSGYLYTRKGKLLMFSWMNNHFTVPASHIRRYMNDFLLWMHEQY